MLNGGVFQYIQQHRTQEKKKILRSATAPLRIVHTVVY